MKPEDLSLKKQLENTFIKKEDIQNIYEPNVLAAMITSASMMAIVSEGNASKEMTTEELLDLYGKTEDKNVTDLIGMPPNFVKMNTGYSVDFQNYSEASVAYQSEKETYDRIYEKIYSRNEMRKLGNGKNI